MSSTTANLWDEVWAEYDARMAPAAVARPAPALARTRPRATVRGRRVGRWAAALLALGLGTYLAAPVLASQQVTAAIAADDPAGLEALVDWPALQAGMHEDLAAAALPLGRTAGLSSAGLDYLQAMARETASGMASADGLATLLRRRLGLEGGAEPAPARLLPEGLTRTRMVLAAADGSDASVALTLALVEPWRLRWQVVALDVAE